MLAAYGVDVLDPRVSTRRVWSLLNRLPPHARRPGESWSVEAELLALVVDHLAELTWLTVRANSKKGAHVPRPAPLPRPPHRAIAEPRTAPGTAAAVPGLADGARTSSWFEAAAILARSPNVRVVNDA